MDTSIDSELPRVSPLKNNPSKSKPLSYNILNGLVTSRKSESKCRNKDKNLQGSNAFLSDQIKIKFKEKAETVLSRLKIPSNVLPADLSRDISYATPNHVASSKLDYRDEIKFSPDHLHLLNIHFDHIFNSKNLIDNIDTLDKAMDKLIAPNIKLKKGSESPVIHLTQSRQPLLTLGNPPGRKECEILSEWTMAKLKEHPDTSKERLIYEFSLLELIRQVSVQCIERGSLFKQLFNGLKHTYDAIIDKVQHKKIEDQATLKLKLTTTEETLQDIQTQLEMVSILIRLKQSLKN